MVKKIRCNPVFYSIFLGLILSFLYGGFTLLFQGLSEHIGTLALQLMSSTVNIIFAVCAIFLLGMIKQTNGFKYIFKKKGIAKGVVALLPVIIFFFFGLLLNTGGFIFSNSEAVMIFPFIAFSQVTSALVQNILFRGLLVTALLMKLSNTKGERVRSVFIASALYLIVYIPLNIIGGDIGFMQIINTFVVGAGFCAAYLYSKNLLGLVFVQGIWLILSAGIAIFGVESYVEPSPLMGIFLLLIMLAIISFAVIFSRRAESLVNNIAHKEASHEKPEN